MRGALAVLLAVCACDRVFGVEFDDRGNDAAVDALPPGDWIAIETATRISCGIRSDRSLWCWGTDASGALGIEGAVDAQRPTRVGTATWHQISMKDQSVCGIQDGDGSLWCWGRNDTAQLGLPADTLVHAPTRVGVARWSSVSAGTYHACGIQEDGTLWCWGANHTGQLGAGTITTNRPDPAPVTVGGPWASVAAGADHTCAIKGDGTLWCWGANYTGQLGQPLVQFQTPEPGQVGTDSWTRITAGVYASCGILASGRLRCWGFNDRGQLGLGTTTIQVRPRPVGNDAGEWTAIHLGENHACGVRAGELWCWGDNEHGAIARIDAGPIVSTPLRVEQGAPRWSTVSTGARHTCAISEDANLWCVGNDGAGQLGLGTGGPRRVPAQVAGDVRAKEVALGKTTTCIVNRDDRMQCWGSDQFGSLGAESPLATNRPIDVVAIGAWRSLAGGYEDFYCALRDGLRSCWGFGSDGQHGTNTFVARDVPVEDPAYVWTQVTTGLQHACGLQATTGNVFCWGTNFWGQLGSSNTMPNYEEGMAVGGTAAIYKAVVAGSQHTCAIDSTNALRCWGLDTSGQLGDGAVTNVAEPTPKVIDPGPISQVGLGGAHTCALSGTELSCWGWHGRGQLGLGDTGSDYIVLPAAIPGTWKAVALGTDHTCGIDLAGALWCWGRNDRGQVGDGTLEDRAVAVMIDAGPWLDVRARVSHTCGIKDDGTVWCWGEAYDGQIGDGLAWTRELRWVPPP